MKQKPRWTLEMLTASLAVLCGLLVLVLLIQRPTAWPALLALVVLWGVVVVLFRCQLRKWVARWMCGGSFEGSSCSSVWSRSLSRPRCFPVRRCCGTMHSSAPVC